jgi:GNAT superfamily N-acetyltransferase
MSSIEVRPFRRGDREQLTALVNAHVAAVVPGMSVSVNAVLSQLEREPGEFIVGPWVRPAPGVYGVPEQWPHIRAAYERAGFVHDGHTEIVYIATVDQLPRPTEPPMKGLSLHRSLGINGTRLSAVLEDGVVGYIEVDVREGAGPVPRHPGWADVGNLHVGEEHRRRGIATWLVGHAAEWLRLARVERVLDYAWLENEDYAAFLGAVGFRELTRTERGWIRTPLGGGS